MKLTKKFGKLFLTIKIGPRMRLRKNYICSDPNLLEELFNTKQFANFSERNSVNYVRPDVAHLFLANGERWANLRKSASIFTNKNIRSMNKLIEDSIIDVLNEMKIGAKKCDVVDFCDSSNNSTTRLEVILGNLLLNNGVKAAGLQTISFALSCIVHFMAAHPQIQEKLRINLQNEDNNLFLNTSSEKELIDGVINETLRLCPIVALWFNSPHSPSSFLALLPFGFGPRRCVGIPLAKYVLKKALTAIILRFRIICENACEVKNKR
uniref:Cytochrome P450 n=1 Tax=Meloidogyne floridensis TaxID=298350 RepID=A0A915PDU8_9BILA